MKNDFLNNRNLGENYALFSLTEVKWGNFSPLRDEALRQSIATKHCDEASMKHWDEAFRRSIETKHCDEASMKHWDEALKAWDALKAFEDARFIGNIERNSSYSIQDSALNAFRMQMGAMLVGSWAAVLSQRDTSYGYDTRVTGLINGGHMCQQWTLGWDNFMMLTFNFLSHLPHRPVRVTFTVQFQCIY